MRKQAAQRVSDLLEVPKCHGKPVTTYSILNQMKLNEPGIAAPSIYGTLTALPEQRRAYEIEPIKAFVPCRCNHEAFVPVLAVCEACGAVEEHNGTPLLPQRQLVSAQFAFQATRHIVENYGRRETWAD